MAYNINEHFFSVREDYRYRYTYIIAEIGINHNGSIDLAKGLIDAAAMCGVDAVKFQLRNLDDIYTKKIIDDPNSAEWNFEYIMPILKDTHLSAEQLSELKEYSKEKYNLDFIVTPFDVNSAWSCIYDIRVDAFKIGSMDMVNYDLIQKCSSYDKVMIISTGMWTEEEIKTSVERFNSLQMDYFLLLANSTYPTPYESINLEFLKTLEEIHPFIGYSGHERGGFIPVAAAALGARIIEKHITFDRNQPGPDHKASMLPSEFKKMVDDLRNLEKALGKHKVVNQAEQLAKQTFVRAAYAKKDLPEGHILNISDVYFKAPGKGILRHEISKYLGEKLTYPIKKDNYLTKHNFEEVVLIKDWNLPRFKHKWGVKCRFHDFDEYNELNSPVIEFHMSQKDLDINFNGKSKSQLVVHAPEIFDKKLVDICSDDENTVKGSIELLQRSIEKTIRIGRGFSGERPKFVVHLGGMTLDDVLNPSEDMMNRAIDNFKKLKFNPDDIEILPENLPPRPWYFGGQFFQYGFMTAEDMMMFCDYFGLKMTLDVCHAALHCNHDHIDLNLYVEKLLEYTSHFHLSDATGIDGEGVQVGEGTMDFDNLMRVIKGKKGDFSWVTEIWSGHLNHGAGCRHSMHNLGRFNNII